MKYVHYVIARPNLDDQYLGSYKVYRPLKLYLIDGPGYTMSSHWSARAMGTVTYSYEEACNWVPALAEHNPSYVYEIKKLMVL